MIGKGFSNHVSRSQMQTFEFGDCIYCNETVIRARVKGTQREQVFCPTPTGGTEIDRVYSLHTCPRWDEYDE